MKKKDFYKIFIPALEKALENDDKNYGFYVKSPEDYLNEDDYLKVYTFMEMNNNDPLIEMTAYYFDAKSHNFPNIDGIDINFYKKKIKDLINEIKPDLADL